jgi:hypothetical protein
MPAAATIGPSVPRRADSRFAPTAPERGRSPSAALGLEQGHRKFAGPLLVRRAASGDRSRSVRNRNAAFTQQAGSGAVLPDQSGVPARGRSPSAALRLERDHGRFGWPRTISRAASGDRSRSVPNGSAALPLPAKLWTLNLGPWTPFLTSRQTLSK